MKYLLLGILGYLVAAQAMGQVWENIVVRQAAAHDMLLTASNVRIFPVLRVPLLYLQEDQLQHHVHAVSTTIRERVAERTDILQMYVDLLHNKPVDVDKLAADLYAEMADVATLYTSSQKTTSLGKFSWRWGGGSSDVLTKLDDASRQSILARVLRDAADMRQKKQQREGSNTPITDLYSVLRERMDEDDLRITSGLFEFYQAFPQINETLTDEEVAMMHRMLVDKKNSAPSIMGELDLVMTSSVIKKDGIDWQQQIHLADIYNRSHLKKLIKKYYDMEEASYVTDGYKDGSIAKKDLNNPRTSAALYALEWQTEWQITWENLREERALSKAWGELMLTIGLDWQTMGQLLYPDDKRSAAYFMARMMGIDVERVNTVLQDYRATLQDDNAIASIDTFLTELPHLIEKMLLMGEVVQLFNDKLLTEDKGGHVGLDGNSPYSVLRTAMDYAVATAGHWYYLNIKQLTEYKHWYVPAFTLANYLHEIGLTEEQLRQHIFTAAGFDKLQRGESFDSNDLNALRQLLSEEQVATLLHDYDIEDGQREVIIERLQILPTIMQLEGFVHKLAEGLSSEAEFLQVLKNIDDDDMYAPLALIVLELYRPSSQPNKKGKRRKRNTGSPFRNIRNALAKIPEQINAAQREYLAAIATPQLDTEQEIEQRAQQAALKIQTEQQQLWAEAAQRDIKQQVDKLAKQIGHEKLPPNTPIWLRLRALLIYFDADAKELGQRAAMKNISSQRFAKLLDPNSMVLPTKVELDSIAKALTQYTFKREKNSVITAKERHRLLENMAIEVEAMQDLIAMANQWK